MAINKDTTTLPPNGKGRYLLWQLEIVASFISCKLLSKLLTDLTDFHYLKNILFCCCLLDIWHTTIHTYYKIIEAKPIAHPDLRSHKSKTESLSYTSPCISVDILKSFESTIGLLNPMLKSYPIHNVLW